MSVSTITSTFNYCTPAASTVTSTVYTTVLQAACPTGVWEATYVITDYCNGSCNGYQVPQIPPGFVVSTVHCPVCPTTDVVITCPTSGVATPTGPLPPPVVTGNGVTACSTCGNNNGNGTPTITVIESTCTSGCGAATTYPPGVVNPAPPASPNGPGGNTPGAPGGGPVGPAGTPAGGASTTKPGSYPTKPPVVAGATSVSRSLGLISGLAAIAGYIYLL